MLTVQMSGARRRLGSVLYVLGATAGLALSLSGCRRGEASASAAAPPAPDVSVATVKPSQVHEWDEFNGRISAIGTVEIRPRVSGYVQRVAYSGIAAERDQRAPVGQAVGTEVRNFAVVDENDARAVGQNKTAQTHQLRDVRPIADDNAANRHAPVFRLARRRAVFGLRHTPTRHFMAAHAIQHRPMDVATNGLSNFSPIVARQPVCGMMPWRMRHAPAK